MCTHLGKIDICVLCVVFIRVHTYSHTHIKQCVVEAWERRNIENSFMAKTKRACKPCAIPLMRTYNIHTDNKTRISRVHSVAHSCDFFSFFLFFSSLPIQFYIHCFFVLHFFHRLIPIHFRLASTTHTKHIDINVCTNIGINYTHKMASILICWFYSWLIFFLNSLFRPNESSEIHWNCINQLSWIYKRKNFHSHEWASAMIWPCYKRNKYEHWNKAKLTIAQLTAQQHSEVRRWMKLYTYSIYI